MDKISFVIPCYGSEFTIKDVVNEIIITLESRQVCDFEIILVNDSSPDNVFQVITELAQQNVNIKGIDLAKNFGQHSALMTGFHFVTGEIIVCLDDDGQTPANEVFLLTDKLRDGYDIVFAKYKTKKHSFFRNLGSFINE
ncbi:MAG: glycosyl transferase family 2, partial [Oscillospiraceae bacterium]|nr:glycosyl transferase family 2 [Oscillospiraceae bacterium]